MDDFARYLASLAGSWRALAAPHADAVVVSDDSFVASLHPRSVLNNAIVLDPARLAEVESFYRGVDEYAVWSRDDDAATARALERLGMRRDITTRPMVCRLDDVADAPAGTGIEIELGVDPARIATLNGVPADLVLGVPGLRAYASADDASGLVIIPVDDDVNVSFVVTRPHARRRGLAGAIVRAALADAHRLGFVTATLQATPAAERLYATVGFRPVARWQEWLPG